MEVHGEWLAVCLWEFKWGGKNMRKILVFLLILGILGSCQKKEEKETENRNPKIQEKLILEKKENIQAEINLIKQVKKEIPVTQKSEEEELEEARKEIRKNLPKQFKIIYLSLNKGDENYYYNIEDKEGNEYFVVMVNKILNKKLNKMYCEYVFIDKKNLQIIKKKILEEGELSKLFKVNSHPKGYPYALSEYSSEYGISNEKKQSIDNQYQQNLKICQEIWKIIAKDTSCIILKTKNKNYFFYDYDWIDKSNENSSYFGFFEPKAKKVKIIYPGKERCQEKKCFFVTLYGLGDYFYYDNDTEKVFFGGIVKESNKSKNYPEVESGFYQYDIKKKQITPLFLNTDNIIMGKHLYNQFIKFDPGVIDKINNSHWLVIRFGAWINQKNYSGILGVWVE